GRRLGHHVEVIDLAALARGEPVEVGAPAGRAAADPPPSPVEATEPAFEVVSMLFADAVGFSRLGETQVRRFVDSFLARAAETLRASVHAPMARNTWGDGLYLVFPDVEAAGLLALELLEATGSTDWREVGLPEDLDLRVGLHVGPVLRCVNPITGRVDHLGTHVSRAARIEPVTPPGEVYATEEFAAAAAARRVSAFVCEYVGQVPLAKLYGSFPTYHVRPAARAPIPASPPPPPPP